MINNLRKLGLIVCRSDWGDVSQPNEVIKAVASLCEEELLISDQTIFSLG